MGVPRGWLSSTRRSKPRTPSSAATLPTHTTAPRGTFHPPKTFRVSTQPPASLLILGQPDALRIS